METKPCKQCKEEFEPVNERPSHPAIFCTRRCFFDSRLRAGRNLQSSDKTRIPLTKGKIAIIDAEDFDRVSRLTWHLLDQKKNTCYAVANIYTSGKMTTLRMHRFILNASPCLSIDHINGDGLDNRKANLRSCTTTENQMNKKPSRRGTSKYKGVFWNNQKNKWQSRISTAGKVIHLGFYQSEVDAAIAYDTAALKYFREFARPNFNSLAAQPQEIAV